MSPPDVFSPRRPGGPYYSDPVQGWTLPLGKVAGIQFFISYSVFVAFAVLGGMVAMIQTRPGNGDLPETALIALGVWVLGWMVQLAVFLGFHFGFGYKSYSMTIGLMGVESPNRLWEPRPWKATTTIIVISNALIAVFLTGLVLLGVHATMFGSWSIDELRLLMNPPSVGMGEGDSILVASTWLCWVQVLCQLFPLQRNLGRALVCAVASVIGAETDELFQVKIAKRFLQIAAIGTLLLGLAAIASRSGSVFPQWIVLVFLGILLWISTRSGDLRDAMVAHQLAQDGVPGLAHTSEDLDVTPSGWIVQWMDSVRMRRKRKLAQEALDRERGEAADAARLDTVLEIVSRDGTDGLSEDDRALLKRVSDNLRRQRAADHSADETDEPS